MCCERTVGTIKCAAEVADPAEYPGDQERLTRLYMDVKLHCPDRQKSHPTRILYPSNVNPIDIFDAVVSTKCDEYGDEYLDLLIRHDLLFPDSETAKIAQVIRRITQVEVNEPVA